MYYTCPVIDIQNYAQNMRSKLRARNICTDGIMVLITFKMVFIGTIKFKNTFHIPRRRANDGV